ncbi:MAG: iron ABC transporter permease [Chloroflexi bacterium]|nr:iron ABC transporter permease [Chloroflexota bacterium]
MGIDIATRLKEIKMVGGPGRNFPWPPTIIWLPAVAVLLLVLLPLAYLALRTMGAGSDLWGLLFRPRIFQILVRTVLLVVAVSGVSLAVSLPLAWLTTRTDLPLRRVWAVLTALPLVMPSYVAGFVVIAAFGPRGMLQQLLAGTFGLERLPEIYGFPGALLAIAMISYPYTLLTLQASIRGLDYSLEEASLSLGNNGWKTFRRVVLPQLRPAIATSTLLVALYALKDFGAVSLMRYETFTWAIYIQYQTSFDRVLAAGLSTVLVIVAIIILFIEAYTRGTAKYHRVTVGIARQPVYRRLGAWRWPSLVFCSLVVLLTTVLPISVLLYWLIRAMVVGERFDIAWSPALNSGYVSLLAALVTVVAALPVAILAVRFPGRMSSFLERTTYIGFALPGIVIALALVFFGANYAIVFYQTLVFLVLAYMILFLPEAVGALRSSLLQINPRLEEAARTMGRTPWQTLRSITIPLMRSGILVGAALVFLTTMKELPATLLLSPIGFRTLAASIWSYTSEGFFARAAVPALLLMLLSSVPMAFMVIRERRGKIE